MKFTERNKLKNSFEKARKGAVHELSAEVSCFNLHVILKCEAASPYVRVRSACLHALRKVLVRCADVILYCVYRFCIDLPSQTLVRLQEQMFAVFTASF